MSLQSTLRAVAAEVPDTLTAALVLLPEGYVLGAVGEGGMMEAEQLARAALRCFEDSDFVEYFALTAETTLAFQRGRKEPRIALCTVSRREVNLGMVLVMTRSGVERIEAEVDIASLVA